MRKRSENRAGSAFERGAAMVEVAIVTPLLMLLVLGAAELGLRVETSQTVVNATRSAARVASSAGDDRLADYDVLATLDAALASVDDADVERIIVFKPQADGSLSLLCRLGSVPGECNHYSGSDLNTPPSAFAGVNSCLLGSPDIDWCPIDRETEQAVGTDWIGIRIEVRHTSLAPFLADRTVADTTVMRLEPRFNP